MIHIVAAIASNGVIGKDGKIPWHISADLKRFKSLTMGGVLVMGRKTYESIGRPLPGRETIVLRRESVVMPATVRCANNLSIALEWCRKFASEKEVFVVGGAEVYREALACADRLHLTRVLADFEGDVSFPQWDQSQFQLVKQEANDEDSLGKLDFTFETWERKGRRAA